MWDWSACEQSYKTLCILHPYVEVSDRRLVLKVETALSIVSYCECLLQHFSVIKKIVF